MSQDFLDLLISRAWNRPVREAEGYRIIQTSTGYQIVVNVLGIKEKDLELKAEHGVLSVNGKTENEALQFTNSVSYRFAIGNIESQIKEIEYEVADGLLVIQLITKTEPEKPIAIKRK